MTVVPVHEISEDEHHVAEAFQQLLRLLLKTFSGKKGRGADLAAYKEFRKAAKRFANYPFATGLMDWIAKEDKRLAEIFNSKRGKDTKKATLAQAVQNLEHAFLQGDMQTCFNLTPGVEKLLASMAHMHTNPDEHLKKELRNPYFIENPLFFGREGLLSQFEESDMERLAKLDLNTFRYSYLKIPQRKMDDFEYLVYWMDKLRNSPDPVELSDYEFTKYSKYTYDSDAYDNLTMLVKRYLSGNDKKVIPDILEQLKQFPELVKRNEDKKKSIRIVYRGIPLGGEDEKGRTIDSPEQVIKLDRASKFIATSEDKHVARRFALQIGHLESEEARRSEEGVILVYEVTPDAILLDTNIFGGKFGEDEVLIDVAKARFVKYFLV